MNKKYKFIDLFAGIGGLRIPFDEAGVCVFTSEKDAHARSTYQQFFTNDLHSIDTDVTKFSDSVPNDFPDHDLLLAGFPCQPFSHAGKRLGFEDTRGTLFFSIANIVKHKQPKVVLLENVKGLLNHDSGHTFATILATLEELGYVSHHQVLNARDFGLPQNRNRLFIVAIRKDVNGASTYSFPPPSHDRNELRVGDFLEPEAAVKYTISDRLWAGHKARKSKNVAKGTGFGYQMVDHDSNYTATLSARYYKDGSEILVAQGNQNPRKITPREASNLQGFPPNFAPNKSDIQAYKQFGNAVPVSVIRAIAQTLSVYLEIRD